MKVVTTEEVSFEWLYMFHRISPSDSKAKTTKVHKTLKWHQARNYKVLLKRFHLNGHIS